MRQHLTPGRDALRKHGALRRYFALTLKFQKRFPGNLPAQRVSQERDECPFST
jgi:hypothetical protein